MKTLTGKKKTIYKKNIQPDKAENISPPGYKHLSKFALWFILGASLGLFFFLSFVAIAYKEFYQNRIYPGVFVDNIDFGGKSKDEVQKSFAQKNAAIQKASLTFTASDQIATVSARALQIGYDDKLLAEQAYSIGRASNILSNISLIFQAFITGIHLQPAYHYREDKLDAVLIPMKAALTKEPINALFNFENGRVSAFKLSEDGQTIDTEEVKKTILKKVINQSNTKLSQNIVITVPLLILKPKITTDKANNLGIKELLATGTSLFQHSIENRIYNISLAATRLNGLLVAPGEVFSTVKALGDISSLTGYKQAYVIENGRTVLGDGGGVCQVSTTLFRATLNAGLPILERNQHAYRVGYYEQDSAPGIDAAIYTPSVDFKFKNDTGNYILIQTWINPDQLRLTFALYGTKDGRVTEINQPVIMSQSPAPEPLYQDDPTLPKGVVKQIDFAAGGARVYFSRTVRKDNKVIIADTYSSNYRPWKAIFLRGTKE